MRLLYQPSPVGSDTIILEAGSLTEPLKFPRSVSRVGRAEAHRQAASDLADTLDDVGSQHLFQNVFHCSLLANRVPIRGLEIEGQIATRHRLAALAPAEALIRLMVIDAATSGLSWATIDKTSVSVAAHSMSCSCVAGNPRRKDESECQSHV